MTTPRAVGHPEPRSAGDPIPPDCVRIEVHVTELKQLFNAMDPSPFREKGLDPNAEEFIVAWAREAPRDATLALLVYLDRPRGAGSASSCAWGAPAWSSASPSWPHRSPRGT